MWSTLVFVSFACVLINADYVTKKLCRDVDTSHCTIHSVQVDPCPDGPGVCSMKRRKPYNINIDFTPTFSTNKLKLSMFADDKNTNTFDRVIKVRDDVCDPISCTIVADKRNNLDVVLTLDKKLPATSKFPVKLKMWNEDDVTQVCCFTFNVRSLK